MSVGEEDSTTAALTPWHLGEKVMDDVVVGDVVQEKAAHPAEEVTVHSRGGASLEIPLRLAIVRQRRVRVVEVRDHDEPVSPSAVGQRHEKERRRGRALRVV